LPLHGQELFFRIEVRIVRGFRVSFRLGSFPQSLIGMTLLESQIVGHAKDPATEVAPRLSQAKVAKEREKDLLDDFFPIVTGDSKGGNVTQEPASISVKESHDFQFKIGGALRTLRSGHRRQRPNMRRIGWRRGHLVAGSSFLDSIACAVLLAL
jgi:hypothetical protein